MGAMHKMAVYLGLVEDEVDGYADDLDRHDSPSNGSRHAEPVRSGVGTARREESGYPAVREVRPVSTPPRPAPRTEQLDRLDLRDDAPFDREQPGAESYRITTLHPRSYNDARRIGEEFRQNIPVIMNLTEMDDEDAKRIIDFAAGLIFGLHGSIERVTNKVFLLSPANVDVAAEARRLAQDGFFNQS